MEIAEKISQFLNINKNHFVSVYQGRKRLAKETLPKYSFSMSDIISIYGTVENFIQSIPDNGFTGEVSIVLKSIHGTGATARSNNREILTVNFTKKEKTTMQQPTEQPMQNVQQLAENPVGMQPMPVVQPAPYVGMGFAQVPQMELTRYEVIKVRFEDLKKENAKLEDEVKDLKSEVRNLKEENFSLRLKIDTSEEKHTLKLERELLNKKGFWESETGSNIVNGLAGVLPTIIDKFSSSNAVGGALAAPNLSEMKRNFINFIASPEISDQQIEACFSFLTAGEQ